MEKTWRSCSGSVPNVPGRLAAEGAPANPKKKGNPLLKQSTIIGLSSPSEEEEERSLSSLQMRFECTVCLEDFSESGSHAPRNLSCGHTFCTGKIDRISTSSKHDNNHYLGDVFET